MQRQELAIKFYEAARAELIVRIRLRENIIIFYVGAVATLLGVAFGNTAKSNEILFVIPVLSLAASILVSHHNSLIGALGLYCAVELKDCLNSNLDSTVVQWDESKSLINGSSKAVRTRLVPHLLIIPAPVLITLIANVDYLSVLCSWKAVVWFVGLGCFVSSSAYIFLSGLDRKRSFGEIGSIIQKI
ncbi:hypothetical protein HL669_14665 [Vibrio parahaemolyticus]|uniref:hypothetical protein n=1 Tax=Vibrio parahaemolyticus TaxID=670 RepID=UPI0014858A3B|nr:hypothetical protein [Vibrio parahaemolyticus]EGR2232614.1 hypothetical protein [Vibrio parahaemolyticus]NNU12878.1 hypothetical protein [Vibrio parahaemolyticus]